MNERIWVVVPHRGHDRPSNETECTQPVEDDAPKTCRLTYPGVCETLTVSTQKAYPMRLRRSTTNMKRVVVAAQAVQDSLFGGNFVFGNIVRFAVVRDRFALGRASNRFGKFLARGLRTKVEARTLRTHQSL